VLLVRLWATATGNGAAIGDGAAAGANGVALGAGTTAAANTVSVGGRRIQQVEAGVAAVSFRES